MPKLYKPYLHIECAEAVINRGYVKSLPYVYSPDKGGFYIVDGKKVTEEDVLKKYPCEIKKVNWKGDNPDKTKIPS